MIAEVCVGALALVFAVLAASSWRMTEWEWRHRPISPLPQDSYLYDQHRAIAVFALVATAAATTVLTARLMDARNFLASLEGLQLMCWLALGVGLLMFSACRVQAQIGGHPFWCAIRNPRKAWR